MSKASSRPEESTDSPTPTQESFGEEVRTLRSSSRQQASLSYQAPSRPGNEPEEEEEYFSEGPGSDTETEMSDRRSDKHREGSKSSSKSSSSKSSSSKSSSKSSPKSKTKTDDWSDVVEPDERRRIQNRIAQRKFREKAKEQKEAKERDAENQQRAYQIYSPPSPRDLNADDELSGLPWGSINLRHVMERGKADGRGSYAQSAYGQSAYGGNQSAGSPDSYGQSYGGAYYSGGSDQ